MKKRLVPLIQQLDTSEGGKINGGRSLALANVERTYDAKENGDQILTDYMEDLEKNPKAFAFFENYVIS